MEQHPPPNARAVFDRALDIHRPALRQAYLVDACGDDPALRRHVEALLHAYNMAGSFLEAPASPGVDVEVTLDQPAPPLREGPGSVVGPYELVEQLGEGGMGVVFLAEQRRPV